jgi:hypothetical protein
MSLRPGLPDGRPLTVRASAEVPSATGVPHFNPSPPLLISREDVNNSMSMPLAHPDLPSGDLDPVRFVSLIEDVSALRSAIAIRAHVRTVWYLALRP